MKKLLISISVLAVIAMACGGLRNGSGDDDDSGTVGEPQLSAVDAELTAKVISNAVVRVLTDTNNPPHAVMPKSLVGLKEASSSNTPINGNESGSCSIINVTGHADLAADQITFEKSGDLVCDNMVENLPDLGLVSLNGTVHIDANGTVKNDGSAIDITCKVSWSNITVGVGDAAPTSVAAGDYTLTMTGNATTITLTVDGSVGGQTVNTSYNYSYESQASPEDDDGDDDVLDDDFVNGDAYGLYGDYGVNFEDIERLVVLDYEYTFIGLLNHNNGDPVSLCNGSGGFGSSAGEFSVWNSSGIYGSSDSPYSAFNDNTESPPEIYYLLKGEDDVQENYYFLAYLTTNDELEPIANSYGVLTALQEAGCDIDR